VLRSLPTIADIVKYVLFGVKVWYIAILSGVGNEYNDWFWFGSEYCELPTGLVMEGISYPPQNMVSPVIDSGLDMSTGGNTRSPLSGLRALFC